MKFLRFVTAILAGISTFSILAQTSPTDTIKAWTQEWQQQYLADRDNPQKWSIEKYLQDLQDFPNSKKKPMEPAVFPVPSYDLYPGTFDGIVAANFNITLPDGQRVACVVNANEATSLTASRVGDNAIDVFLLLAVVTDCPEDTEGYDDINVDGFSRNHPDVVTQGYVRISDNHNVDFTAFRAANDDAYAIINMRLFNLNDGNIVIIVPQQDGSLRSKQLKATEPLSFSNLRSYMTTLLTEDQAVMRFVADRNDEFARKAAVQNK